MRSRPCWPPSRPSGIASLVLGDLVGYGAEPNGVIDRVRALEPGRRSSAAITTRRRAESRTRSNFNQIAKYAAKWTSRRSPTTTASTSARCRRAGDDRRPRRDLPRRAVRRGPLHLRCRRRAAGAGYERAPAVPVRPHPPAGRVPDRRPARSTDSCRKGNAPLVARAREDLRYSIKPGRSASRATATRARPSRIYDADTAHARDCSGVTVLRVDAAQRRIIGRRASRESRATGSGCGPR